MSKYHMRRQDLLLNDQSKISKIIKQGKYINIALCKDNEPYIVCLSYGYDEGKNKLYMHCATEGQKLEFIKANSQACGNIIVDRGYVEGQCDHAYTSVVIRGQFSEVEDNELKKEALIVMAEQLESDPSVMKTKISAMSDRLNKVTILCLSIEEATGRVSNS